MAMDVAQIGQALYDQVVLVHPELAGKLVGMLLQLGQEECLACLDSIEDLGERLDEAMKILDEREANSVAASLAKQKQAAAASRLAAKGARDNEQRVDLEDGVPRTFAEMTQLCAGRYTAAEIEEYWQSLPALGTPAAAEARAKAAKAVVAPSAPSRTASDPEPARTASASVPALAPAAVLAPSPPVTGPVEEAEGAADEAVAGLAVFLEQVSLSKYLATASAWVEEQGACNLEEVVENLEDFAAGLELRPLELNRLLRGAEAAVAVARESTQRCPPPRPSPSVEAAPLSQATCTAPPAQAAELPDAAAGPGKRPQEDFSALAAEREEFPSLGAAVGKKGPRKKF